MTLFSYSIDHANKIRDELIENNAYRFYKNRLPEVIICLIRDGLADLKEVNSEILKILLMKSFENTQIIQIIINLVIVKKVCILIT
jgi:hypothetical protein